MSATGTKSLCSQLSNATFLQAQYHQSQQLAISQVGNQVQALQKQLEVGSFQDLVRRPRLHHPRNPHRSLMAAPVCWSIWSRSVPFGSLKISVSQTVDSEAEGERSTGSPWQSKVTVTFVPPQWLSHTMLRFVLQACGDQSDHLSLPRTELIPVSINCNPLLLEAIGYDDVMALQRLFDAKLARHDDKIWDESQGPISLIDVRNVIHIP